MPWDRRALSRRAGVLFAVTALFAAVPVPAFAQAQMLLLLGRPSIPSGAFTLGIVVLDQPAPEGGTVVTLTSDTPAVVTVPASVTVPAEHTAAFFVVATTPVATTTTVLVAATAGSATSTVALILLGTDARLPDVNPDSGRQAACDGEQPACRPESWFAHRACPSVAPSRITPGGELRRWAPPGSA